ncbi:MAG: AAA family ATPase [Campylobacter sp.]|uniref:ATP-binding protein n=1 Tax=Campylobacter sp. TaxID=205 RepID=UPI002A74E392|nr:AAA family ATPase [Campylobacter sp.]MCI7501125.1 AAA family ATPase [Campylobacter sp.]MDY3245203.1 AAA family ATPase [Campylobacter sp.]
MKFPIVYELCSGVFYKIPEQSSSNWQIIKQSDYNVLIAKEYLYTKWLETGLLKDFMYKIIAFMGENFMLIISQRDNIICHLEHFHTYIDDNEAISFGLALEQSRKILGEDIALQDGIFVEKYSLILPTFSTIESISDELLLGKWITGGINVPITSTKRIAQLSLLKEQTIAKLAKEDIKEKKAKHSSQVNKEEVFALPGRIELTKFFNEHIIDIIQNEERYRALGIDFPSSIILYGPPGSGKTHAVNKLVDFLNWPCYRIEASSVASPYIHETSKKIAEVFEEAMENAPSVLIIDEMEAFLSDREGSHKHSIEEVAEFLRRIPEAIEKHVLIIAMTNKLDMIDPAVLRRGRFDHKILVDYTSEEEILLMLEESFKKISVCNDLDVVSFAKKLSNRPMSDVAFFIKEGARIAAKNRKDKLDNASLNEALKMVLNDKKEVENKKVGFIG